MGWTEPRPWYLRPLHGPPWLHVLDLAAASAVAWTKVFRGSPSLLKSMSETRQNTARRNQLLLVPSCKWQQTKVGKTLLPCLLLRNRQVREEKGLGKGIEKQEFVFCKKHELFQKNLPVDMESHSGTSCHTNGALLLSRAIAADAGSSRNLEP